MVKESSIEKEIELSWKEWTPVYGLVRGITNRIQGKKYSKVSDIKANIFSIYHTTYLVLGSYMFYQRLIK